MQALPRWRHPPVWYSPELVKTEKELEDEELKELVSRKLRESKKSKKKKDGEAATSAAWRDTGDTVNQKKIERSSS